MPLAVAEFSARDAELRSPFIAPLRAGPVTLDFVDGDLRHLRAGGEELVRRITFNVRHHKWDTAAWQLEHFHLRQEAERFDLEFSARCEVAGAPYTWSAHIRGSPDGTLLYRVTGVAQAETREIRRAGLNLLYATACVTGQPFETTHLDGQVVSQRFPELVPAHHLPATDFTRIRHRTKAGAAVTVELEGAQFGLEDQRVAGDSSFKVFSGLRHTYAPALARGDTATQQLSVRVTNLATAGPALECTRIVVTPGTRPTSRLPKLSPARFQAKNGLFHEPTRRPAAKNGIFLDVNLATDRSHGARALTWGWYPTINLYDDEVVMENASSISGQLLSAHRFAAEAVLRVEPIAFDSIHPRATPRDPRNDLPFAAAWLVAATQHLALGGAAEGAFALDGPFAQAALSALAPDHGCAVSFPVVQADSPVPVAAFAVHRPTGLVLWLANRTPAGERVSLQGLPANAFLILQRLHAGTGPVFQRLPGGFASSTGCVSLQLHPYEVCAINVD